MANEKAKLLDLLPEEVATAIRQEVVDELKEAAAGASAEEVKNKKQAKTSDDIDKLVDILMPGYKRSKS